MTRNFAKILMLILSLLTLAYSSFAQSKKYIPLKPPDSLAGRGRRDSIGQKDMGDVLESLFNVKPAKSKDTVGMKPVISIVPALGYSLQSRLAVLLAGNA